MRVTLEDGILENCNQSGAHFIKKLQELKKKYPFIQEIRGKGLMVGMECSREVKGTVNECLKKGFLINCVSDTIMRFVPPLIIRPAEIDRLIATLDEIFSTWNG